MRRDGVASEVRLFEVALADVDLRMPGDVTADGVFDSGDLVSVFQRGEYEDRTRRNSIFTEGDWNSDGDFDSGDLVFVFKLGTYSAVGAASAVPEPAPRLSATAALFFIAARLLASRR